MMNRLDKARMLLKDKINDGNTYGTLANDLHTSKGAIWKFINTSYVPRDSALRRRLLKLTPPPPPRKNWKLKRALLGRWIIKRWKKENAKEI
jgi:hypothetical protein